MERRDLGGAQDERVGVLARDAHHGHLSALLLLLLLGESPR